jgi:hypothetical protein
MRQDVSLIEFPDHGSHASAVHADEPWTETGQLAAYQGAFGDPTPFFHFTGMRR